MLATQMGLLLAEAGHFFCPLILHVSHFMDVKKIHCIMNHFLHPFTYFKVAEHCPFLKMSSFILWPRKMELGTQHGRVGLC